MPFHPTRTTAQHALDEVQGQAADNNYAWREGCVPSLTNATGSIESETTAGTILFDGELIDLPLTTHQHDAGDGTHPRWDALVVTDRTGTIEVVKGVPNEPATLPDGTVLRGESAFAPAPSDTISREMVPLALVWIPSGAQTNQDLTDQTAGGVADPVIDRRYPSPGNAREQSYRTTIQSGGWYRIASNGPVQNGGTGGDRAHALFTVRSSGQGMHSAATFYASVEYNQNPTLTLLNTSFFGSGGAIGEIRLISPDPSEPFAGSAVEVKANLGSQSDIDIEYSLFDNRHTSGWTPEPWTAGDVPGGFETTKIEVDGFNPLMAAAANGTNTPFYIGRRGAVHTPTLDAETINTNPGTVSVRMTGQQTIPSENRTVVQFDTVANDTLNAYDAANNQFITPADGFYQLRAFVLWASAVPAGTNTKLSITRGDGTPLRSVYHVIGSGAGETVDGSMTQKLTQNTTVKVRAEQDSGSGRVIQPYPPTTRFEIVKIG